MSEHYDSDSRCLQVLVALSLILKYYDKMQWNLMRLGNQPWDHFVVLAGFENSLGGRVVVF